jgi:hypothetical protein
MIIKTGYCVIDGICGDLSFEEGGNPVTSNRIIAGRNPLLLDSYCAELIGYRPDEIEYISYGKQMGVGDYYSRDIKLVELNPQAKPALDVRRNRVSEQYQRLIDEDAACSACYSSLVYALHRLKGNPRTDGKIHIGQGFAGKSSAGFGVGNCTSGYAKYVPGCPPKATDILEALRL